MSFLFVAEMIPASSVAWDLMLLSMSITLGLTLGGISFRGIRLGVSGVLFASLLFGQIGLSLDPKVLAFLRDFALVMFVYTIGLQVGPSFAASLRSEGLRLNLLSLAVVGAGAVMTAGFVAFARVPGHAASGIYSGGFTTTPGLAAGQDALRQKLAAAPDHGQGALTMAGLAYTVAYPFGVVGPIFVIVLLRRMFKVNLEDERAALLAADESRRMPIDVMDFEVTDPAQAGRALKDNPLLRSSGVIFSRLMRDNTVVTPTGDTLVQLGDVFRAVGHREGLEDVISVMGRRRNHADMDHAAGDVKRLDIVVTRAQVLRRPLRELDLIRRTGVTIGRVTRAGVELVPRATLKLQFGDHVAAVGPEAGLKVVEAELGNSPDTLNKTQLIPIFLGMAMGILVGSIPLGIPGLSARLRIGLAGGPMIAAIVLSQLGNIGSVVWYMPVAASQLFRDFGLAVFLACVGLQSGDHFFQRVASGFGLELVLFGAVVTVVPMLLVASAARWLLKMNFITLTGLVAGAMTSTPSLVFATDLTASDAPAIAYAAIAPLAMLTPILCAQVLVIVLS